MRLAANDIERSLQQAADDQKAAGNRATTEQLDALAQAFRTADKLSRAPFGRAYVKGRKDGVDREVLTTQATVVGKNGLTYRYVLQRFTEAEGGRQITPTFLYRRMRWNARTEEYMPDPSLPWGRKRLPRQSLEASGIDTRPLMPQNYHLLLVREDRLRR